MSKFLDRLEQITEGAPPPMGFRAPRGRKTPGMALVGQVSGADSEGVSALADLEPDAVLISGAINAAAKESAQALKDGASWGVRAPALSQEDAQGLEEEGCDLLAFSLAGTPLAAVTSEEMARVLCLDRDIDSEQLRAVDTLPVDVLLLSGFDVSGAWTLEDLLALARISSRVGKYILLDISQTPAAKELEALRNTGVNGLVADVGTFDSQGLAELKQALLDMPRQKPPRRERAAAILSRSAFSLEQRDAQPEPEPEPEEEE